MSFFLLFRRHSTIKVYICINTYIYIYIYIDNNKSVAARFLTVFLFLIGYF